MTSSLAIDAALTEWGEHVFNSSPIRKVKARKGITGLHLPLQKRKGAVLGGAKNVRACLNSIIRRTPQVMVKISGGGKSIARIKAHLDYISRNGRLEVVDQDGNKLHGKDDIDALRDEWQYGGFPIVEDSNRREAFNIVLSMPAGTSELAVLRAARDFAAIEFGNFQYAMVLHTMDTDPDPEPSPNPHVHLCVKATGLDGARLNPRKEDLQRWREHFAERLGEHGIDAAATRRIHRLQHVRGEKQSVRHKRLRGEAFRSVGHFGASDKRIEHARRSEASLLANYRQIARVLAGSDDVEDRKLAVALSGRLANRLPAARRPAPDHRQEPER